MESIINLRRFTANFYFKKYSSFVYFKHDKNAALLIIFFFSF